MTDLIDRLKEFKAVCEGEDGGEIYRVAGIDGPELVDDVIAALVEKDREIQRLTESAETSLKTNLLCHQHHIRLEAENERLRQALKTVLASAVPNAKEHPTMFAAWNMAAEALKERE